MLRLRPSRYRIIAGLLAVALVLVFLKLFEGGSHRAADIEAPAGHHLR